MINIQFKNEELLDLYSILIKFSDRLQNQDSLELIHTSLLKVLNTICPEKEVQEINNEICLDKLQLFKKWYDQQITKINELEKTEKTSCDCGGNCCDKQKILDDLNTKCNGNISGGTFVDTNDIQPEALKTMKVPGFKR